MQLECFAEVIAAWYWSYQGASAVFQYVSRVDGQRGQAENWESRAIAGKICECPKGEASSPVVHVRHQCAEMSNSCLLHLQIWSLSASTQKVTSIIHLHPRMNGRIDSRCSDQYEIIDLSCKARKGVLYQIPDCQGWRGQVITGCGILHTSC